MTTSADLTAPTAPSLTAPAAPSPTYDQGVLREIARRVIAAAAALAAEGVDAGVVCLTSPDLVFRSFQQRGRREAGVGGNIADELFPAGHPAPLVTVLNGHPHTLAFLAGVRGDRIRCLGVTEFGQSSGLDDAYRIHHIDTGSIVDAALTMAGR